jgi:hypothetical protein
MTERNIVVIDANETLLDLNTLYPTEPKRA